MDSLTDEQIDTSDIPPVTEAQFGRAKARWPAEMVEVTLHLDPEILAWFQAQGGEYERRLNAALRLYVEAHRVYSE